MRHKQEKTFLVFPFFAPLAADRDVTTVAAEFTARAHSERNAVQVNAKRIGNDGSGVGKSVQDKCHVMPSAGLNGGGCVEGFPEWFTAAVTWVFIPATDIQSRCLSIVVEVPNSLLGEPTGEAANNVVGVPVYRTWVTTNRIQ